MSWGFALAYAGFACLCLGTERGGRLVLRRGAQAAWALRFAGWGLVCGSAWPVLAGGGAGAGLVSWALLLTVAAGPLTVGLAYAPRLVALAGPVVAVGWAAWGG